jgi:hypothetical protein
MCSQPYVKALDEQRAEGVFPSSVYSREVEDTNVWTPKSEAWKVQQEAAAERETNYRAFFASQK